MKFITKLMLLSVSLLFILIPVCSGITNAAGMEKEVLPLSSHGELDARELAGEKGSQIIPLQGQWEFYWKQLLEPGDWARGELRRTYLEVPASWANYTFDADAANSYGFGTYRLLLRVPDSDIGANKALFIRGVSSAYRLWIDGVEMPGVGTVGTSRATEQPQSQMNLAFFQPRQQTVELVIQVSNYSFREGGLISEIDYGDIGALIPYILKELLYDVLMLGGFLLLGLYHLTVFGMRKRDSSTLYIGLVAIAVAMRTLFINGYLSSLLLGIDNWELLVKLEYSAELAAFLSTVLLMRSLYPREVHRAMVNISVVISIGLFLFVLLTPVRVYSESMLLQSAVKAVILLYFVFYVGVLAFARKREGAAINLIALLIIVAALANDTFYYLRVWETAELLNYSIVPFLMAQAIIVSYRYSLLSERNDILVAELEGSNATLEQKVEARTQNLYEANQQLSEMKDIRTKMLVHIAHDLSSPLIGIQTYLKLILENRIKEPMSMIRPLLDKTVYLQSLIHDLFELSKLESEELVFQFQNVAVKDWMKQLHGELRAELMHDGIELQLDRLETDYKGQEAYVRIDRLRMSQTLHNLLDNAVKFSRGHSTEIKLRCFARSKLEGTGYEVVVEVTDYGSGISEEELPQVFRRFYKRRERNSRGSGLGLAIVKEIVEQHQGMVGVRSQEGAGSTFYFILPGYEREI